ncbi:MAG: hypothetical protein AAFP04_14815 [Myxococcota bacterium]
MKAFVIAAFMAALGMTMTSSLVLLALGESTSSRPSAPSDAEIDNYISELIDEHYARVLEKRLDGRVETVVVSR